MVVRQIGSLQRNPFLRTTASPSPSSPTPVTTWPPCRARPDRSRLWANRTWIGPAARRGLSRGRGAGRGMLTVMHSWLLRSPRPGVRTEKCSLSARTCAQRPDDDGSDAIPPVTRVRVAGRLAVRPDAELPDTRLHVAVVNMLGFYLPPTRK